MGRTKKENSTEEEVGTASSEQVKVQSVSEEKKVSEVVPDHSTGGDSVLLTNVTFTNES